MLTDLDSRLKKFKKKTITTVIITELPAEAHRVD